MVLVQGADDLLEVGVEGLVCIPTPGLGLACRVQRHPLVPQGLVDHPGQGRPAVGCVNVT